MVRILTRTERPASPAVGEGEAPEKALSTPKGGQEHALVIDDEAGIRNLVRTVMETEGYRVSEASDLAAGLAALRDAGRLDLVLIDHTLGEETAEEAVKSARALHPRARVILASGHPQSELGGRYNGQELVFLAKPFTIGKLKAAMRGVKGHGA